MLKFVWAVGVIAALMFGAGGLMVAASESGEVVVLRSRDAAGDVHETRLWIVEDAGFAWLRAGSPESGWYARLQAQPAVEVVRGDATLLFTAEPEHGPARVATTNRLMAEKYGWGDRVISLSAPSRESSVAVRLVPR